MRSGEDVTLDEMNGLFAERFPETGSEVARVLGEWVPGEPGEHTFYSEVCNPYLVDLLRSGRDDERLRDVFEFIEELASNYDPNVRNVVYVTVMEGLMDHEQLGPDRTLEQFMRPVSLVAYHELKAYLAELGKVRADGKQEPASAAGRSGAELNAVLAERFPDLHAEIEEEMTWEPMAYELYQRVFAPHVGRLLTPGGDEKKLTEAFGFLEELAADPDPHVGRLVEEAVLSYLLGCKRAFFGKAKERMGPMTLGLAKDMEADWDEEHARILAVKRAAKADDRVAGRH